MAAFAMGGTTAAGFVIATGGLTVLAGGIPPLVVGGMAMLGAYAAKKLHDHGRKKSPLTI